MNAGIVGGIIGTLLGLAGGIIGTYFSIKNTDGPAERRFMQKVSIVVWVAGILFIILIFILPNPYRWLMFIPYGILLPLGIMHINRRQAQIKKEEAERSTEEENS